MEEILRDATAGRPAALGTACLYTSYEKSERRGVIAPVSREARDHYVEIVDRLRAEHGVRVRAWLGQDGQGPIICLHVPEAYNRTPIEAIMQGFALHHPAFVAGNWENYSLVSY